MSIRELVHWNRPFGISVRRKNANPNSLAALQDEMNNFFERLYAGLNARITDWDGNDIPAVNIKENEKSFEIQAALPGIDPKDVDVQTTEGFLTIRGEHATQTEDKEEKDGCEYLCQEMSEGYFQRTVALPETADCDKADAIFKNGILTVTVPKKPEALQKPKKVQIKKAA